MLPFYFLGSKVRVSKVYWAENATEHREVVIPCSLESSGNSASLLSVMWFRHREDSRSEMLVHLQHDGLLVYGEDSLQRHLYCYRSSPTDFVLKLHRVEMGDAGVYWCRVTEWQLHGTPSSLVNQSSDVSQHIVLTVLPSGKQGLTCRGSWLLGRRIFVSPPAFPPACGLLLLWAEHNCRLPQKMTLPFRSIVTQLDAPGLHEILA